MRILPVGPDATISLSPPVLARYQLLTIGGLVQRRFGVRLGGDSPNFATAVRDAAVILIALSDQPERLVHHWQIVDKMWDAYIRVDDVDAIYAEVQERGAGIDYTLCDAPHGVREFGGQDPDGHDIAFGQRLEV